ncbi:MAG: glycoside hydrolase family 88 protein, partial [Rikenellaceae bacterium]
EFDRVHASKFIFSTHSAKVGIIILLGGLNAYTYKVNLSQPTITDVTDKEQIKELMAMVSDWQLTFSFTDKTKLDWHWGAFYEGLIEAYKVTGDKRYFEEMMNIGEYYDWGLEEDILHADRLLICDIYAYLYEQTGRKNPEMMRSTDLAMNLHTSRKAKVDPRYKGAEYKYEWWSWCDALYMAAPTFYTYSNLTGDAAARDFAFNQWKVVSDYLYSEEDALFYRDDRYFDAVSTNGGKVFWARGNGWVMGALTRILRDCPKDSDHYAYYEKMYRDMCAKFLELQREEGLWTVSLLDPEELLRGESSGSGFYGFAFAWGVNNGILDESVYGPAAKKAWKALSHNVSQFGRLGYVQQVAGSPYPFYEYQAHTYASGAFLLFANEMLKME